MTGRPLNPQEKALWDRLVASVKPLHVRPVPTRSPVKAPEPPVAAPIAPPALAKRVKGRVPPPRPAPAPPPKPQPITPGALDGSWDRKLAKGSVTPDLHVDLHGHGLAGAYARLDAALEMAVAEGLRAILLVTGKPREHDRASGSGRGAIRAAVTDWLAVSRFSTDIAAVRNAHPRHGGEGALYIIMRRR